MSSVFRAGTPYGKAHDHADRAELLYARGDYEGAAEEHQRAADTYLKAIDACEDESVKHSLRLMHEDHLKLSREAQRARQERTRREHEQPPTPDLTATVTLGHHDVPRRMVDSASSSEHTTIEDSYMMLGGRPGEHNEAFDQFWKTLEGMLENLSQPVAFATAPLGTPAPGGNGGHSADDDGGSDSDASSNDSFCIIDSSNPATSQTPKKATSATSSPTGTRRSKSRPTPDPSLARSAYPPPPRIQQLEAENAALKADLERAVTRATTAERTLRQRAGQELALRESILSVRREAQRAMSATTAALRTPAFGQAPSRTQTLIQSPSISSPSQALPQAPVPAPTVKLPDVPSPRIAELEEEIRQLKAENEKQASPYLEPQMAKYRERWEKLKESAKRKRAAKEMQNGVIPEEQEPGEGADIPEAPSPNRSGLSSSPSVLRSPGDIVTGVGGLNLNV
ncbi:ERM domain-containing protein [Ceratobasidium sp. AG-Ba]|nr:ERM domain-containing protein [Ceratobasidium sp. AG-Ba]